jgi:aminopeptidase N
VGDPTFFHILPAWSAQNKYGNVTTSDFIALAERKSGRNLTRFFRVWLFQGLPESW